MPKARYTFDDSVEHDDGDTEISLEDKVTTNDNPEDAGDEPETNPGSDFDDLHPNLFKDVKPPVEDEEELDENGDPVETEEAEEEEDEDEVDLSKTPFRKRLARIERTVNELKEDNRELSARNKALEQSTNQRKVLAEFETKKTEATTKLEAARTELERLLEDGTDTKAIREATEALSDVKADLREITRDAERAAKVEEAAPAPKLAIKKAERWKRAHPKFEKDRAFAGFTREIDKTLQEEGYDPNDEDFWTELDNRVKVRFPEEYRGKQGEQVRRKPPTRDTGHADRGAGQPRRRPGESFQRRGNKVIVTAAQKANMRRFGMDPDNADDLKTYIRENTGKK